MSSLDDDDGWEDMPVIRQDTHTDLDHDDRKRYHWNPSANSRISTDPSSIAGASTLGNATGRLLDYTAGGVEWREKEKLDEMDYTRLELDDDPEEDEISMRTQYLFNEEKGMTPLAQMQTTKTLLTEGQRIAYVGLCRLVARELVQMLVLAAKGAKELEPAKESAQNWANKIMGRLYRHMEVDGAEQRMIEQLAEHGVTAEDLVPSLVTTHTVPNPEYDPDATAEDLDEPSSIPPPADAPDSIPSTSEPTPADSVDDVTRTAEEEPSQSSPEERIEKEAAAVAAAAKVEKEERREFLELEKGRVLREVEKIEKRSSLPASPKGLSLPSSPRRATSNPFGQEMEDAVAPTLRPAAVVQPPSTRISDPFDDFDDGGDIGGALDGPTTPKAPRLAFSTSPPRTPTTPTTLSPTTLSPTTFSPVQSPPPAIRPELESEPESVPLPSSPTSPALLPPSSPSTHQPENFLSPLPSTLPGVSKTLTAADKTITLDIRWTILCDLFLSLIADSVYDARSRVLLGKVADKLGLEWMDVVRFERRMTEALEIQEGVKEKENGIVLEEQRKKGMRTRYMMMGLATLGGGLVIGLSAGLLAPVIGAGLGAALTTVGVTGTTGFLAGAGGAAIISSGATITGSVIGGKAMAKRTRHVKRFEFQPLHNNKRVNFFIAVPGFMNGPLDDVRLPFSTIDPVMGDVFSVLWEPEMMGDTGNALKILTTEVFTQVGQQVLAATVMTALLSALQWPLMLTKLGYLIDNPWSNALDRARQAGAVLADILINRSMGVRPVSLVGFSLGARVIFYALVELAKVKAFGVVEEVYLFGATLTASKKVWRQVRGVVSGRFVNAFAMNDWVLGYLFRATSGGLNTVAGLRPIEFVPDLENVDITEILVGHMSYRTLMPKLLEHVGFKTTADHFDEPEEMEQDAPDREVLTKEEEERRKEKKAKGRMGGLFGRKKMGSQSGPTPVSKEEEVEDDLPPRMGTYSGSVDDLPSSSRHSRSTSNLSTSSLPSIVDTDDPREEEPEAAAASTSALPPPPPAERSAPVGFDLAKLREEVSHVPSPPSSPLPALDPTDLSGLGTTVDARDLLQAQWTDPPSLSTPSDEWAPTPYSFVPTPFEPELPTRPPSPPLEFKFGNADAWGSEPEAPERDVEDPVGGYQWGRANKSSASLGGRNPW